ncbi:hypothetical protein OG785_42480 [Streptomyces sp. NBC_00006]|uniref:hypothetical protein n=1 Tax=unclassified Streptomyces TaxID=2593676 RepID=UPI00225AA8F4|nr:MULTISPECIES: hypothetical protein [unclassified Streptomyces]MCX4835578.1 hypothetical protein [Streptomyces sp. NBC_01016]MCX5537222.1 hypothetical protein [Streptomyces sp. NBC_00006]
MSDQWPSHHPAPVPGPPSGYGPPQVPQLGVGYRRWAGVLLWLAIVLAGLMVVAFVVSLVFLTKADADGGNASYGYLALFLWFGIAAAIPVLLALGIPGLVMTRRVRRQRHHRPLQRPTG